MNTCTCGGIKEMQKLYSERNSEILISFDSCAALHIVMWVKIDCVY